MGGGGRGGNVILYEGTSQWEARKENKSPFATQIIQLTFMSSFSGHLKIFSFFLSRCRQVLRNTLKG